MKLAVGATLASYTPPHRLPPSSCAPLHRPSPIALRSFPLVRVYSRQACAAGASLKYMAPLCVWGCIYSGWAPKHVPSSLSIFAA